MRCVIYLGTRSCPAAVEAAVSQPPGSVVILVASDPSLLGEHRGDEAIETLVEVGRIHRERALDRAAEVAEREAQAYADVFGEEPSGVLDQIQARVTEHGLLEAFETVVNQAPVEEVTAARDALEILEGASLDLRARLPESVGLEIV